MNTVDAYITDIPRNIQAPPGQRERIEADLRAHFQEAVATGEPVESILARMGDPAEVAQEFMAQVRLNYAGFWPRLAAFAVDMLILIPVIVVLSLIAALISNTVPQHPAGAQYVYGAVVILLTISIIVMIIGVVFLYFPMLEGRFGRTVGKRLLKLRVLKENGLPVGDREAFLRKISFYFNGIFIIDSLFIPFTAKHQRAFDIVAQTIVVKES
jgi:uncharacterized RDD family membrane protein YckC